MGEDEIALVRKKLKWNNDPFVVPENILKAWREIGKKGIELEKKWIETLGKKILKLNQN